MPEYSDPTYPDAGPLVGDEYLLVVQAGVTKRVSVQDIANLAGAGLTPGTVTGQLLAWDNDLGQWVIVTPNPASAADIPAISTGYINSDGTTTQAILDDFDAAISGGGGGGGGGIIVADTFTRANNASVVGNADTGQTWTVVGGTWGIIDNTLYRTTTGTDSLVIETGVTDMDVEVAMPTLGGISNSFEAVMARWVDDNNRYTASKSAYNEMQLAKRVAGVNTTIGGPTNVGGSWVAGDRIRIRAIGTTIEALRNNAVIISVTDSSLTTGTKAGIRVGGSNNAARFDGFKVS